MHFDHELPVTEAARAALGWRVRLMDPNASQSLQKDFEAWRDASRENAEAYEELSAIWDEMTDVAGTAFDAAGARDGVFSIIHQHGMIAARTVARSVNTAAIASVIVVSLITVLFVQTRDRAVVESFRTEIGEREVFSLSDGTRLNLNTGSLAEVSFHKKLRLVRLVEGQASFVVSPDPDRPFIVTADETSILATGTEFDVLKSDALVKVVLLEGAVKVASGISERSEISRLTDRDSAQSDIDAVILDAGDEVSVMRASGAITPVVDTDLERAREWRDGKITFRDTLLIDAIEEMNRYTPLEIRLESPALQDMRMSGAFETDGVERFVSAVEALFDLKSQRRGRLIILTPK
ncbi:MAG: FecR domain-containing protein [Pseudomonadota bacterium]